MDELQKRAMLVMLQSIEEKIDTVLAILDRDMAEKEVFLLRLYLAHMRGCVSVMSADVIEQREYVTEKVPF